jgi:excisionase family DNA binding protein
MTAAAALTPADRATAPMQGLARVVDAERYLNVSRATVYNLMENGTLRYVKIGRSRRIPWTELQRLAGV